jgi:protein-disulfide isomerase
VPEQKSWQRWLDVTASVATCVAAVLLIWILLKPPRSGPEIRLPPDPVSIEDAVLRGRGSPDASVVVLGFGDFECPYSARFSRDVLPQVFLEYVDSGRVQWFFHHLPLPQHASAVGAAIASECAARQDKFWDMHDALFINQDDLVAARLLEIAESTGLNLEEFEPCVRDVAMAKGVESGRSMAIATGLSSTPTMLIGLREPSGKVRFVDHLEGAASVDAIREVLDRAEAGEERSRWTVVTAAVVVPFGLGVSWVAWYLRRRKRPVGAR